MKFILYILLFFYSCTKEQRPSDCTNPIGNLFFSSINIDYGEIYIHQEYVYTIKIYNPTSKNIYFKIHENTPELSINRNKDILSDKLNDGFILPAHRFEVFDIMLTPHNLSLLGKYIKYIYFEADDNILLTPLKLEAIIFENFDQLPLEDRQIRPHIVVEQETFCFDTVSGDKDIPINFIIKNIGERNLIIRKVETFCGCTSLTSTQRIVEPDKQFKLNFIFHPQNHSGTQRKTIYLHCNDPKQSRKELIIKGYIKK